MRIRLLAGFFALMVVCFGQEFLQTVDCGDGISRRLAAHQSSWALRIPEANSPPERGHNHSGTGRNAHVPRHCSGGMMPTIPFRGDIQKTPIWAQELCVLAFFALKSAIISRLKAGRSEGCRLLIQLRSRTTSRSTH